jgi:hypothetical protein
MLHPSVSPSIPNTSSKSKMISRRLGGGEEAYCTYVEEADNDANKDSALIYNWDSSSSSQFRYSLLPLIIGTAMISGVS